MADVYQQERGLQQQAATAAPMLPLPDPARSPSPALNYAGVKPAADIVQQFAGQRRCHAGHDVLRTPGASDYAMQGGLAGMAGY